MRLNIPDREFSALIFDCDGTLIHSMPLHYRAWSAALSQHGARFDFSWELFTSRAGMGVEHTVDELNQQFDMAMDPASVAAAQARNYEALLPAVSPIAPVVDFAAANRHLPMAVASGGERALVIQALTQLELVGWFDPIVCQEDVTLGKPDPEMFLQCAKRMGVLPERCLVFEDGELGMRAAERAGMAWVAVDDSGRNSE